jgi:hypothetical protein
VSLGVFSSGAAVGVFVSGTIVYAICQGAPLHLASVFLLIAAAYFCGGFWYQLSVRADGGLIARWVSPWRRKADELRE